VKKISHLIGGSAKTYMDKKNNIIISSLLLLVALAILNSWIGNPFGDFLLKFFSDRTNGILTYAGEYEEYDDNGNLHTYYGYNYEYKINDRLIKKSESHEGYLKDDFYDITPENPKTIEIEYVYFLPNISQIKGSGYPSTFWYLIKSLLLKTIIYIGVLIYYLRNIRNDVLGLINDSINNTDKIPDTVDFNWKYQLFSAITDFLLIFISIGLFSLPSMILKDGWLLIGILFLIWGLIISYYLTKRMEEGVAVILYCIVLIIVFFFLHTRGVSPIEKGLTIAVQITLIKWVIEVILTKIGYKISYPVIDWLKEKKANR